MDRKEPSLLGSIFGAKAPTTVDGVMEAFNHTIAQLEAVELAHRVQAAAHAEAIQKANIQLAAASAEADRASTIATKMKGIFK